MRILQRSSPVVLLLAAGIACADGGLKVDKIGGFWSSAPGQLQLNALVLETARRYSGATGADMGASAAPLAASVTGDYYFSKNLADAAQPRSGFRASSALLLRPAGVPLSELAWSSRSMASFAAPSRPLLGYQAPRLGEAPEPAMNALPYLGIGYSDYSLKNGWSFWADVGVVMQSAGATGTLGRPLTGTQSLDDMVRELQLSPMLQLGVNYAF